MEVTEAKVTQPDFIEALASRQRFGVSPGLDSIRALCARLGRPERDVRAVHIAGTNGKGAVVAMVEACLRKAGASTLRYTSPHLVRVNERFSLSGAEIEDAELSSILGEVERACAGTEATFFEVLTAAAFLAAKKHGVDFAILETGLGGRLDATSICNPLACAITSVGLDHCAWLGGTVREIALEKAGIAKRGVPLVLGKNCAEVRKTVEAAAEKAGAPFFYAPEIAGEDEIPPGFSLGGSFNRENAVTALAVLKTLSRLAGARWDVSALEEVVWPGRFQRCGRFIIDGAHNPPAMEAFAGSLPEKCVLVAGFCADKAVAEALRAIAPKVLAGFAVATNNPRSLSAEDMAAEMSAAGIKAQACGSLAEALSAAEKAAGSFPGVPVAVCGSLFLAGEALTALGALPAGRRFDPAERFQNSPGA